MSEYLLMKSHSSTRYCTVLYCTLLYSTLLYCTVLYCTLLHCTALYCTVLHSTLMYKAVQMPQLYCMWPLFYLTFMVTSSNMMGSDEIIELTTSVLLSFNLYQSLLAVLMCTSVEGLAHFTSTRQLSLKCSIIILRY